MTIFRVGSVSDGYSVNCVRKKTLLKQLQPDELEELEERLLDELEEELLDDLREDELLDELDDEEGFRQHVYWYDLTMIDVPRVPCWTLSLATLPLQGSMV